MREHLAALGYPDLYTHGGASSKVASCIHAPIVSILEIIFRLRPALHFAHLKLKFPLDDKRSTILLWVAALTRRRAFDSSGTDTNSF